MTFLIKSAVMLVLDVVVLVAMGVILGRKNQPRYLKLLAGSLAVAVAYLVYDLTQPLFGYLLFVPVIAAPAVVLVVYGRLRWKQAAVASAVFFFVHFLIHVMAGRLI